jgi:transcriptional regulator with XRE-family HTH domain
MTKAKTTKRPKRFDELRKHIDADPTRRARVEEHKQEMLGELRRKLDLTQAVVADRLDVTQENVSQIERGEADVRLSTLSRYVEALGGRLEVRATFPGESVALKVGDTATMSRQRTRAVAAKRKKPRATKATRTGKAAAASRLAQPPSKSEAKRAKSS